MMIKFAFHRHANEVLKNETTMFEKFLKRVDPKDIGLQQAGEFCLVFFWSLITSVMVMSGYQYILCYFTTDFL